MKSYHYKYIGLFLFAVLVYFPLFLHLDALPLRLWDEARRGVNTIELLDNGHWFIPHFDGHPDMWGTKPPLLIWLQAFFAAVLGVSELSIRLPSALAGMATVVVIVIFAAKVLRRPMAGYFSALVLLTTGMYIRHHGPISGDYDALLTCLETAYLLCAYLYWSRHRRKWLYIMAVGILLAVWTKGAAGLFFVPGIGIVFLLTHRGRQALSQAHFWWIAGLTLTLCLSYYFIRKVYNPGYLTQVWNNELFGRFTEEKSGPGRPFTYYLAYIYRENGFFPWLYFLPLAFLLGLRSARTRYFTAMIGITALFFLLIISSAATKLSWYVLPVFPMLALIVGMGLERLYAGLLKVLHIAQHTKAARMTLVLFGLSLFTYPYLETVGRIYEAGIPPTEQNSELYRDFIRQLPPGEQEFTILYDQYNATAVFYQMLYNRKGYRIRTSMLHPPGPNLPMHPGTHPKPDFKAGDRVMVCEQGAKQYLEEGYEWDGLHYFHNCRLVVIH